MNEVQLDRMLAALADPTRRAILTRLASGDATVSELCEPFGMHTIHFERTLAGSEGDAFCAWTEPDQVSAWWDPTGEPLLRCEIDLRVGGAFTFVNAGHSPPFAGTFHVVDRPSKLVFEAMGSLGTVQFEQTGEHTQMRVQIRCPSADHLAHFVKLGVADGTDRTLDNLVAHLARQSRSRAGAVKVER